MLANADAVARGASTTLAVLLHAFVRSSASLVHVGDAVKEALPDADLIAPDMPLSLFSNANPSALALEVIEAINRAQRERTKRLGAPYPRIVLIGHSLGALIARKVYVIARGQTQDIGDRGALQRSAEEWAGSVERIILLAAMNRGWSLSKPHPRGQTWLRRQWIRFGTLLLWPLRIGLTMKKVRRGSPFITNLRVQWLNLVRSEQPPCPTIQLLGDRDDAVAPQDDVDVESGHDFIYLNVAGTGHPDVIDFSGAAGAERKRVFLEALTGDPATMQPDYDADRAFETHPEVEEVVFVMHGIRDGGFWATKLGERIEQRAAEQGRNVVAITASYGYFAMLRFLLFRARQKNVRWFMDQYTEALARYPKADFSFVGHSNGTYLIGSALRRYAPVHFNRVLLAGTVLPTRYEWNTYVQTKRIREIRNYVATNDFVVAVFPALYELLGSRELGGGGHHGFLEQEARRNQLVFIRGGHSAALDERNWNAIAAFIADGTKLDPPGPLFATRQRTFTAVSSRLCWAWWLGILAVVAVGGAGVLALGTVWLAAYVAVLLGILLTI